MGLFDFGKKKECCCDSTNVCTGIESIKVLGAGCKLCHEMYENTKKEAEHVGITAEVEYVTDMETVASYGAMSMPVLVINEKIVSVGKVLKQKEIEKIFQAGNF